MRALPTAFVRAVQRIGSLLTLILLLSPGSARADCICNCDRRCPLDCTDYEVIYSTSGQPIHIRSIYTGISDQATNTLGTQSFPPGNQAILPAHGLFLQVSGNTVYNPPYHSPSGINPPPPTTPFGLIQISGNDTTRVQVTFHTDPLSSQPVMPTGFWTHVGIFGSGSGRFADGFWTINGIPVGGDIDPCRLPGVEFHGNSSDWLLVRVTLYDANGNPCGHEWVEDHATSFTLVGTSMTIPGVSTTSVVVPRVIFPDGIAGEDLNNSLPELLADHGLQFGPESQIQPLQAVPEPASVLLFSAGALGLFARGWRRRKASHA
jgi:hypothetical protein